MYTERNCFPYMLDLALIQADFRTWEIVAGTGVRKRYDFRTSHCLYRKPGICVHLEMRVDSKHRNVGFLALSGRCTVTSLTTAHSQKRTFSEAAPIMVFLAFLGSSR